MMHCLLQALWALGAVWASLASAFVIYWLLGPIGRFLGGLIRRYWDWCSDNIEHEGLQILVAVAPVLGPIVALVVFVACLVNSSLGSK
jgi:uncharacterized membrane protein YeaQ/YmgE (transglycosylase-associated protein family)